MNPLYLLIAFGLVAVGALWVISVIRANDSGFVAGFDLGRRLHQPPEDRQR